MFKLFIKTIISFQGYALPFPFFSVISGCGWKFKKLCTIGKKGFVVYRGEFSHSVMSNFLWSPWTVACQAPLFMEFSRQGYWSGLPFPTSGDLPNPGIEPRSPTVQADALPSEPLGKPFMVYMWYLSLIFKDLCLFSLATGATCWHLSTSSWEVSYPFCFSWF